MLQKESRCAHNNTEPSNICIRSISVYGRTGVLAQSLEYSVPPSSHDEGGPNTISAVLVSRLSNYDVQTVRNWANTTSCYIRTVWGYPGYEYPNFTTRHLLTDDGVHGEVSFRGGLDWALRILENAKAFELIGRPALEPQWPGVPFPADAEGIRKRPLKHPDRMWPISRLHLESLSPPKTPELADDQGSLCSELTSATTISDTDTDFSGSPPSNPAEPRESSPGMGHAADPTADNLHQRAMQNEEFHRQRRSAEALYAHNGDTSGLLAILASVPRSSESWHPSGMPKF
ncbi:hypothetical protein MMYC01_200043 [Madurella mycetomatis]|uniref:Uncharacterized protein n=1 Tax=Madurella mycetomatis TaxID=100816 RepID=A0A150AS96_9PEZI|nr:hypothetical protein MMYC01_200043 [Madurella mycetomatis]